ncbi:MAG: SRPBCC family protein [Chloroflexi bacterium]|nr:SRPBCC family protein [Chloroflexota bacterium]
MLQHQASVTVKKPVDQVFKFAGADYVQNHPKWDKKCVSTTLTSTGSLGVGSTGREVRKQGGRKQEFDFKVTEFVPNKKLVFETTSGPANFASVMTFEGMGGDTKVTMAAKLQFKGMMSLMAPMIGGSFRKEIDASMAELKRLTEA